MLNQKNFKDYFNKLEITSTELSLNLVKEIQKKHLEKFSFNNIAVLLKDEISLDITDIMNKIVRDNRGGYCFEHNKLLHDVLQSLGFNVRILVARVINNQDIDSPKTHRITLLNFEGKKYLIDVGFGAMCPSYLLCIDDLKIKQHGYRIVKTLTNSYKLELLKEEGYFSLYIFDLLDYKESDCVMGNFYSSNYKNAVFVNNFVIALILPNKILSLRNNTYHITTPETTTKRTIDSAFKLDAILSNDFHIQLKQEECKKIFERIKD